MSSRTRKSNLIVVRAGQNSLGLYKSFQEIPDYKDYTYIWLPDDDIDTRAETLNEMFP